MAAFVTKGGEVPVIETERLRLRGHRPEDFPDCAAMWADPVVTRYIGGKPLSEEEAWTRTLRCLGHWAWLGFGYWVVEEKATGSFAGEMGFSDWKREIEPSLKGVPEIGWVFATRVHGKGYATEAARGMIDWAFANLKLKRIVATTEYKNEASMGVMRRVGMTIERNPYPDPFWLEVVGILENPDHR